MIRGLEEVSDHKGFPRGKVEYFDKEMNVRESLLE